MQEVLLGLAIEQPRKDVEACPHYQLLEQSQQNEVARKHIDLLEERELRKTKGSDAESKDEKFRKDRYEVGTTIRKLKKVADLLPDLALPLPHHCSKNLCQNCRAPKKDTPRCLGFCSCILINCLWARHAGDKPKSIPLSVAQESFCEDCVLQKVKQMLDFIKSCAKNYIVRDFSASRITFDI